MSNPYEIRQQLTDTMNDKAYVYRNEKILLKVLKKITRTKDNKLGNMLMIKQKNTILILQM